MAIKWPLANGNWSTAANWIDGTKPVAGDDVYADGRTITINESINVASIRNTQRSGGTIGGQFNAANNIVIVADVYSGPTGGQCLVAPSYSNLLIIGSIFAGSKPAVSHLSVNLTVVGNVWGGSAVDAHGIIFQGLGSVVVTGNVYGGSVSGAYAIGGVFGGGACNAAVEVTGNTIALQGTAIWISTSNGSSCVLVGNVTGGDLGPNSHGVQFAGSTSTGNLAITGKVTSGSQSNSRGVDYNGTGSLSIIGDLESVGANAVAGGGNASLLRIDGNLISGPSAFMPVIASRPVIFNAATPKTHSYRSDDAGSIGPAVAFNSDQAYLPDNSDVRYGVEYGPLDSLVGTCHVPPHAAVIVGVPVDSTVGSAEIDAASIRAAIGLNSANIDLQLASLSNAIGSINVDFTPVIDAIESIPTPVVLPLNASMQSRVSGSTIEVFCNAATVVALGITDAAGNPVDVEDLTLEFVIESMRSRTDKLLIPNGELGKSGSSLNVLIPKSATTQLGQKKWALWDKTAEDVLAHGLLIVNYAPKADA